MEKIKLTKDVAEALEYARKNYMYRMNETLIREHVRSKIEEDGQWIENYAPLNKLNIDQLCTAIYVGYEVELTPEETARTRISKFLNDFYGYEVSDKVLDEIDMIYGNS